MKVRQNFVSSQNIQASLQAFYDKPVLRVTFELILSIFVVAVFALFALRPTLITMSELLKEIEEKQQFNKELQQKMASLSTAQNEWTAFQDEIEKLQLAFFHDPSLEDVLLYLEYLARQESVVVTGMTAPEIAVRATDADFNTNAVGTDPLFLAANGSATTDFTPEKLTPYETSFQVLGTFEGIMEFLQKVESRQPLMSIEALQIAVNENETNLPMSASFRLRVYVLQTPSLDDPAPTDDSATSVQPAAANPNTTSAREDSL